VATGLAVVGLDGRRAGTVVRRTVVDVRKLVVPVEKTVVDTAAVVVGAVLVVDDEVVDDSSAEASRMGRPLLTGWGQPAMATPNAAQTATRTTRETRVVVEPCESMAQA